ncbi:site-specific integrase [Dyella mobilis]|uniref:Site-specific integrase n=1 Tax=Dyella mobilis TaxID=1849582 RepID=A0ABS2KII6_9GAMM|nr:site-specific integrase [Dyella mobilis]MBM7130997.1 site-specific integrase [Dyella mobilis]GLQ97624.1 hypothetical protein GCM10007863_20440 [Dyella mobilis]
MLSNFLKNLVRQKELAYYEVNLNDLTIATLGAEGLERALHLIQQIGSSGQPPAPLTCLPSPLQSFPISESITRHDIAHVGHESVVFDISGALTAIPEPTIVTPGPVLERQAPTVETSTEPSTAQLLEKVVKLVENTIQASEERMAAKLEEHALAMQPEGSCLLSQAQSDFLATDRIRRKHPKTIREYHFFFKSFIEIVGDKKLSDYRYADANVYANAISKLPRYPHLNRAFDNCTYKEMIEIGQQIGAPVIELSTQQRHIKILKAVFHWFADKFNLNRDASEGVDMTQYVRDDDQAGTPFSKDDLEKIFAHARVLKYKHPDEYWIPLIGLYTGMRVNEIAQLYTSDITQEEIFDIATGDTRKIYCFKVQLDADGKKRLKSRNAKRTIPMHSKLIELGLLRYLDDIKARGLKHLFPGLKWGENGPGGEVSSWFNNGYLRNQCEIPDDTKTFHSFRNHFETVGDRSEILETALIRLCGYGRGMSIWRVHYIKDATLEECNKAMLQMVFPKLDLVPYHWRQYKDYLDKVTKNATPEERVAVVVKKKRGRPPKSVALI